MINWSAIDHRSLRGRLLRFPVRALPANTVMRIRSGSAKGMKWIAGSATHGCWLGTYELDKQRALERFLRPEMTVYDIGAQAGFYTLFFSRLVGESGRVYAFEPCPHEAHFLVDHVRMNCLQNVKIIQAAVGVRTELLGLTVDCGQTQNRICSSSGALLTVPVLTLDGAGLTPPDLIKMDVEGAESAVLRGAHTTLRAARPVVFVALHSAEEREHCAMFLREAGYDIYDLSGVALNNSIAVDEIYALPSESIKRRRPL